MEKIELEQDFREFLQLLNDHKVEYLLACGSRKDFGDLDNLP